jgi:hypothetical protein
VIRNQHGAPRATLWQTRGPSGSSLHSWRHLIRSSSVMKLDIVPLTPDRWTALEDLFGELGTCNVCWCMYSRIGSEYRKLGSKSNKQAFRHPMLTVRSDFRRRLLQNCMCPVRTKGQMVGARGFEPPTSWSRTMNLHRYRELAGYTRWLASHK